MRYSLFNLFLKKLQFNQLKTYDVVLFFIFFTFVVGNLILACFSETTEQKKDLNIDESLPKMV